ncbi:LysR family transcriptional regulator [Actinocrispum wychmicini]|uniref:DNA-binding transcriptional LysR family regulator n=1 Tax=Actinocrispum wychmicini TaxID=1213861 RepID=A0A4R2JZP2_9PSEU|nr:LysR family transcriptional regulator [Actinocrispum wychmicini]TCO62906.1 DNA-binding transcriptional LysR family regulator [Actinocrispum wychmicini]
MRDSADRLVPDEYDRVRIDQLIPASADVDLLRALAETGDIPRVAKVLRMSQPAVRRQLIRLERRTAVQLTDAVDEHMRLTEAGQTLLSAGLRFQAALMDAVRVVDGVSRPHPHRQSVVRMATMGRDWDEFVDDMAVLLRDVLFHVVSATPADGSDLFERHCVDVVYGWQSPRRGGRLGRNNTVYDVLSEPLWVSLPADHRYAGHREVPLADLSEDRWIVRADENSRRLLEEVCMSYDFAPTIGHVVRSFSSARSLLGHGEGIALVSPLTALPAAGSRFVVRPLRESPMRTHRLVVDPAVVSARLAAVLCDQLRESYRRKAVRRNPSLLSTVEFWDEPDRQALTAVGTSAATLTSWVAERVPSDRCLEPEDLRLLHVIDTTGSINRAAPMLMITQPALTRKVSRLERRLGVTLLRRGHRGTALTPQARRILVVAAEAEAEFRASLRKMGAHTRLRPAIRSAVAVAPVPPG